MCVVGCRAGQGRQGRLASAACAGHGTHPHPPPAHSRLLANHRLSELELGLVANLSVETPDEAKKLVPSLDTGGASVRGGRGEQGRSRRMQGGCCPCAPADPTPTGRAP